MTCVLSKGPQRRMKFSDGGIHLVHRDGRKVRGRESGPDLEGYAEFPHLGGMVRQRKGPLILVVSHRAMGLLHFEQN